MKKEKEEELIKYEELVAMPEEEAMSFLWLKAEQIAQRAYESDSVRTSYTFHDSNQLMHMLISLLSRYTTARCALDPAFQDRVNEQVNKLRTWEVLAKEPINADENTI